MSTANASRLARELWTLATEANRCEEQVAQAELDLNRNREGLEAREENLA